MQQEMVDVVTGDGANWNQKKCKAPVTSPPPPPQHRHSAFRANLPLVSPSQQCQSIDCQMESPGKHYITLRLFIVA